MFEIQKFNSKLLSPVIFIFFISVVDLYAQTAKKISLNGLWNIEITENQPTQYNQKVKVPGIASMAVPSFDMDLHGNQPPMEISGKYMWYKTEFVLNEKGVQHAILRIRAKYNAEVFLNGISLGYDHHTTYSYGEFMASKAINFNGKNTLVVRVGNWNTASSPSKETQPQFWRDSRCPGIWDNVELELFNNPRIKHVQIIPNINANSILAKITIENITGEPVNGKIKCTVAEKVSGNKASGEHILPYNIPAGATVTDSLVIPCKNITRWTAGKEGNPFLYTLHTTTLNKTQIADIEQTVFGFRTIEIKGADVLVNGEKSFFRAENIAFGRALIRWDYLLFDDNWVRKFLSMLKNDYNFNYLRSHLCHMPDNWYKIADEVGLMIQDEWRYFHDSDPKGKDLEEAEIELTRWVYQNLNHPSIVVWDNENEGDVVLAGLMPKLRKLDPTRPWAEEDFDAPHVYDYSETFTDSIVDDLEHKKPCTVLESCRLWANEFGWPEPRENFKTVKTMTGWGFKYYTVSDVLQLQADIHADLGNFYRSRRFHAWSPFVVLSSDVNGQNYFIGDIGESFSPKPCLFVLRDLNEQFGLSVEMLQAKEWYKDKKLYTPGVSCQKDINIWNDFNVEKSGIVQCILVDTLDAVVFETNFNVSVPAGLSIRKSLTIKMPEKEGIYYLKCLLKHNGSGYTSNSPIRRFMVYRQLTENILGLKGFGGRHKPSDGAVYFSTAYKRAEVSEVARLVIQRELNDAPISNFITKLRNDTAVFEITAEYKKKRIFVIIDVYGNVINKVEKESLKEKDLPQCIRAAITRELGFSPVDEVRISKFTENNTTFYLIESKIGKQKISLKMGSNGQRIDN